MKQNTPRNRVVVLMCFLIIICLFYAVRLMRMQIVNGEYYVDQVERGSLKTQTVEAARGEILDRNGNPLAVNVSSLNIVFDKAYLPGGGENAIILALTETLSEQEEAWNDILPITTEAPYAFAANDSAVTRLKTVLGLAEHATVSDALYWLKDRYKLEGYTDEQIRTIAGVRYSMERADFSIENPYTFAEDISIITATKIKEQSHIFTGVDVIATSVRSYVSGSLAPHIIGIVGPIYEGEYDALREAGYRLSDTVGRTGIEKSFEDQLRGSNGERQITLDKNYDVIDMEVTIPPVPGNTIRLSIDSELQQLVAQSLENRILALRATSSPSQGQMALGGAAVVVDVRTGEILACVTYPSYDVEVYQSDYASLLADPLSPLFNRAVQGSYMPGSIFKPAVALAALSTDVINPLSTVNCTHVYTRFSDYRPTCVGYHGLINLRGALQESCNIFFYDVGYRTGIDTLTEYAHSLGLGVASGVEIPESLGQNATPELRERNGESWVPGHVLQASIGQLDNKFSPLQLASYVTTIANRGERISLTLVNEITDYSQQEVLYSHERTVLNTVNATEESFEAVVSGLVAASRTGTAASYFGSYPIDVASKTGSPESGEYSSATFFAFAPAVEPEIAVVVVIEDAYHGFLAAPVGKEIMDYWFYGQSAYTEE